MNLYRLEDKLIMGDLREKNKDNPINNLHPVFET
jgi:hypothetical protein